MRRILVALASITFLVSLTGLTSSPAHATPALPPGHGYWLVGADGGVFSFGFAGFHGSTGGLTLQRPIVGIAATPDRQGYWLVASDGGVFVFGDARYYGSVPGLGIAPAGSAGPGSQLTAPIAGIVSSPDGHGYLLFGADGGVFAFGDATFAGSCYSFPRGCDAPVAAAVENSDGQGYWFLSTLGTMYNFGSAIPDCEVPPQQIPVTSATPVQMNSGTSYAFLFANGYVIDCTGLIVVGETNRNAPVAPGDRAIAIVTSSNNEYWVVTSRGAVFAFGFSIQSYGSMAGRPLNAPIVGAAGW